MVYDLEGKMYLIKDVQVITEKFKKREFVVVTNNKYPEYIKFQLMNDSVDLTDQFPLNSDVKVSFKVSGKEYQKKGPDGTPIGDVMFFTNLNAIGMESMGTNTKSSPKPAIKFDNSADDDDDLPF